MKYLTLGIICLLQLILKVCGDGKYSVIAPGTLHSGRKYNAAVAVYQIKEPAQFKIGIIGPEYNDVKTVNIQPNEIKSVEFDVPNIKDGSYNLTAEGVSGVIFKNTTKLYYEKFTPIVKIQTDKGTYKPGDEIKFRVLFLDENLKPAESKDVVIFIEDAIRNRIKEFKNIEVIKGVYTGTYQISEYPILGGWQLLVEGKNQNYARRVYFNVEKYVLPKFTVTTEATSSVVVFDGLLNVVVRANYTYDKPFGNGKVLLVIHVGLFSGEKISEAPVIIQHGDMVKGKAKFDVDVHDYEQYLTKMRPYYLSITATVEEEYTGMKINSTAESTIYPYRYNIYCLEYSQCSTFHPETEFELPIKVTRVDNAELKEPKTVAKLIFMEIIQKYYYNSPDFEIKNNKSFTYEAQVNTSNIAIFKVKLDDLEEIKGYEHFYKVMAIYDDEHHNLYDSYPYRKPKEYKPDHRNKEPKDYLKLQPYYKSIKEHSYQAKLGDDITIEVSSSEPLTYFMYNIVGRGNILRSEQITLDTPLKAYNFSFKPDFLMAPSSSIYVYYIDDKGEFHYAELCLGIATELQNQIDIQVPKQVKPGEEVSLNIQTASDSFVGISAVDQSVLLLNQNNDIDPSEFQWILGDYSTRTPSPGGYSHYPGGNSGVVTLTNGDYFYNWTNPYAEKSGEITRFSATSGFVRCKPLRPLRDAIATETTVRKNFAETWIFDNIESAPSGEFVWKKKIPDTITSWVINAFSLSPEKGLGVLQEKQKLITFQPFFVTTRLPYSVKRGEVLNLPVLVFNYLDKNLDVEVTLDNSDGEYDFTEVTNEIINEEKRSKVVTVSANSFGDVSFMIKPKTIGNILLKITAISPLAGDTIHKPLKVVPEGTTAYANRAYFVNLKNSTELMETFDLAVPEDVVPDSEYAEFSVVGDLLGPVIKNLGRLVRMPGGCGEQTMSGTLSNYIVLQYLMKTNQLTPDLKEKLIRHLEIGYQRILTYRHYDYSGSFLAFNPWWLRDHVKTYNGSTWLTAYVIRSLGQIKDYIKVDEKVIKEGLDFLTKQMAENGSFIEHGDFFYNSANRLITLTASALLAFEENKDVAENYKTYIEKGIKYILENFDISNDLHAKAISIYALHKAKHPMVTDFLEKLKTAATTDDDRMWWSQGREINHKFWWRYVYSNDVEITSYILLTLLDSEVYSADDALPIVRWLMTQRNNYGGFSSTQDTVVGLAALTKFVEKSGYKPAIMDIDYVAKGGRSKQGSVKVDEENGLLLQIEEVPQGTKAIEFSAKGKGAALVQISYQYNIYDKENKPSFKITTNVNTNTPKINLEMDVCVEYVDEGDGSNMAIMEVSLPSGFTAEQDSFEDVLSVNRVRLVETKNSDTVMIIYFDSLRINDLVCFPIQALKSHAVASQIKSAIEVYDYYEPTKKATSYYLVDSKLCDICDGDSECIKACS